ncbi:MAG TPA: glutamate-1-semialdehyde 2,1-aminomutase [Candidatus Limnocylindrales bacterium]|nr:glutamate-1-semialdehyde 2,1-aminomutase [Candidatus Limnocylindrales bacterium]
MPLETPVPATSAAATEPPSRQQRLRSEAAALFPGGVNSPVRAFRAVGLPPLVIERGEGPYVVDADGRRYVDYVGAWGAAILGHAHARVVAAIRAALERGLAFGATHPDEIALASAIRGAMPSIELLRFTSSGTEAAMSALRVARAATGCDLVIAFAGGYHGHSDGLLAEAGSGVAAQGIPGSAGVPAPVAAQTIVLPYGDAEAVDAALHRHAGRVAAVIVEPVAANMGVVEPGGAYLAALRRATDAHGTLLVFDEVITGFRVSRGGAQQRYGVTPDLTVLGKVIGGGMPVGAYGGRRDLMRLVAPVGPVYQAGTLAGHPLAMAAGTATLAELSEERYEALEATAAELEQGLRDAARAAGRAVSLARVGSLLTLHFRAAPPRNAAEAGEVDREAYAGFFGAMLDQGILPPPSPLEAWFVSLAHGPAEVAATIAAARRALAA